MTPTKPPIPVRARRPEDGDRPMPLAAVWELTMKCDQACGHCGTRAGRARPDELTTDEVRGVGVALARLGCREVSLIGGEAYLRDDIHAIIAMLKDLGMRIVMQTGGRGITPELARSLASAGLSAMGVSVDGPALVHDKLRGSIGSHRAALSALDAAREAGLLTSSNTQVNRLNHHLLRQTCTELRAHGIESWQVQLTVPMGRAADRPEWIIEPWMVVDVLRTLAELQLEAVREPSDPPFNVICGNNLGYFGPYEAILRSRPGSGKTEHWAGCTAGVNVIGIESDGVVKGCPSLPTAPYTGGNVRDLSLEQIWEHAEELRFNRERSLDDLWGYCRSCYYAEICRGGCSWMTHCALGRRGNNPFCYHRVTDLKKRGIRERLVPVEQAPNRPYDFGRFELQSEPWPEDQGSR